MSIVEIDCSSDEELTDAGKLCVPKEEMPDDKYLDVLQKCFGHQRFRPMQWKIISAILEKKSDVCAIMATGYGKSLCYQFPSVYTDGITVVISPLISLMEDQVLALNMANIASCLLGSAQTQQKTTIEKILEGEYKIIYATPEFCLGDYGFDIMKQIQSNHSIDLLAIDEAHCVSKWGHDFRVQYRNLWKLRSILKGVPILAVTATATPQVQKDICSSLKLKNALNLCSGFDRPNLYFEVKLRTPGGNPYSDIKYCMVNTKKGLEFAGSTIIYCITKKSTEEVSKNLKGYGVDNVVYHAGLTMKQRKTAHENFVKDKIKVVVATIAFGMGIDKPDVRTVIHYGSSKDIESYYQEVGRAGRDGLPSRCIVFFSSTDFTIFQHLRESTFVTNDIKKHQEDSALLMDKYLNISECRRKFILEYFQDNISNYNKTKKNCCDNCTRKLTQPKILNQFEGVDENGLYNYTNDAVLFLKAVQSLGGKFGIQMYCLFIRGSKSSKMYEQYQTYDLYGKGKHCTEEWWKIIARILTSEGFLQKNYQKKVGKAAYSYATVALSHKGTMFLNECSRNQNIELKIEPPKDLKKLLKIKTTPKENVNTSSQWIDKSVGVVNKTQSENSASLTTNSENPVEKLHRTEIYKALLQTRNDIAHNMDVMPYLVASNTALMQMSRLRPKNLEEMMIHAFDGLNDGKIKKFGQKFIDCILNYNLKNPALNAQTNLLQNSKNQLNLLVKQKETNKVKISDLKQFTFIEQPSIRTSQTSDTQANESIESDISDSEFNEIFDKIETDFDENICETVNRDKANKSENENSLLEESKEDDSFDLLDSPKHNRVVTHSNDTSLLDEDSFDNCLVEAVNEVEKSIVKKRPSADDEKDWCHKKKKNNLNKFLDF